jgi:hypothetical protein
LSFGLVLLRLLAHIGGGLLLALASVVASAIAATTISTVAAAARKSGDTRRLDTLLHQRLLHHARHGPRRG